MTGTLLEGRVRWCRIQCEDVSYSAAAVFTRITVIVQVPQVSNSLSKPSSVGVAARQLKRCLCQLSLGSNRVL